MKHFAPITARLITILHSLIPLPSRRCGFSNELWEIYEWRWSLTSKTPNSGVEVYRWFSISLDSSILIDRKGTNFTNFSSTEETTHFPKGSAPVRYNWINGFRRDFMARYTDFHFPSTPLRIGKEKRFNPICFMSSRRSYLCVVSQKKLLMVGEKTLVINNQRRHKKYEKSIKFPRHDRPTARQVPSFVR